MRLYRLPKADGIDDLTLVTEEPPAPQHGQVLIRMHAWSLNYRDLMVATGRYGGGGTRPNLVPLSDGAGEVVAVGSGVTRAKPGDRVCPTFMQGWHGGDVIPEARRRSLGGGVDGILAEQVVVDQQDLVHFPAHLSYEEAATLPCAGVTAWNALYAGRGLQPGETVLVLGTGGVSIFALQFAHAAGARVIATSSSASKLERARALGASDGVNYREHPDWQHEVLALTGGAGVDYVVEVGGAGTLPRSLEAARIGGQVGLIGVLTGGQIDPTPVMRRNVTLRGIYVGSRGLFEAMNRAIALHGLRPVIDRVFAFNEARDAYRHLQSAAHVGKVVISAGS
jgi:NADPH:quinone reductase-like Zn-dependent oxidoreductase